MATTDVSRYKLNHTMLRVKDPEASVKYYDFLGFKQIHKMDFPDNKFSLYFLAHNGPKSVSSGKHWTDREGIIELTHNYGTENDPNFKINNGNSEPFRGFGHVCISVDNIQAACSRIENAGHKFQKKLTDGKMRHIAFALDPDGYWVEIIGQNPADKTEHVKDTNTDTYRMNHTMLRVKSAKASLDFYRNVLGMSLVRTLENKDSGFDLYFLGYEKTKTDDFGVLAGMEGLLELTWNYETTDKTDFKYHDGNAEPQGFGHICISVDDLDAACTRFDDLKVNWKKRLTDGRMKNVAFILDPDGYWIEVIQNEKLKTRSNW